MFKFISVLIGLALIPAPEVTIDRIENNDTAVIEVSYKNTIKMIDVPTEDFNLPVYEGTKISANTTIGTFTGGFEDWDGNTHYQFKSYDNTVWWAITVEEIGFTPTANKLYTLVYYDNGTTDCYECPEEYNCECEVYDDIFLGIY